MAKAAAELAEVHGWERVKLDQFKFIKPPGHAPLLASEAPPAKKQKTEEEPAPAKEQKTEEQPASAPITPPWPTV